MKDLRFVSITDLVYQKTITTGINVFSPISFIQLFYLPILNYMYS